MINIQQYYLQRCKEENWYNNYFQCGDAGDGSIFKCFGTNYRDLSSFEYYFNEFKKYIGIPRSRWPKKDTTGQEIAKQYVVNMVDSFLFISHRLTNGDLVYDLSSRGKDFERMISMDFNDEEKKLLLFIYLMNSGFKKTPRYLLKTAWSVWDEWNQAGYSDETLKNNIVKFLKEQQDIKKIENIFNYDIVWLLGLFSDNEFLKLYNIATENDIKFIKKKAVEDYHISNKENMLAWKYKSTNFQRPALVDTLIIIYLSKIIKDCQIDNVSFNEFYNIIVNNFTKIYNINTNKILSFIFANEDIFKVIFNNAVSDEDDFTERYIPEYRVNTKMVIPTEKIDSTSQEGIEKLEIVRAVLKKLAKDKSNYQCALHDLNNCNYFTSKEEGKNYLEIHHLVPREFSYDFDDTIEFVENYIPLCPRCHRMIHKAVDKERIALINYLFNQRHQELEKHNIKITIKELYDFYKIDKDKL